MNGIAKKFLSSLVFIAAFVVVKYGMDFYREKTALSKLAQSIEQVKKDAVEKHPGVPVSEAMRQEAVNNASVKLNTETDEKKRLITAAGTFMGFYLVNTRERVELCREQGVDIGQFVLAFERGHLAELAKARAALSSSSASEEKLYAMLKPQLRQIIAQGMTDMSSSYKVSLKEACELIATNGATLASEMHISKMQPVVYNVLSSGR